MDSKGCGGEGMDWKHLLAYITGALVGFQGRGFTDVVQPHCCHPLLLEVLLFQWPSIRMCASRTMLEHKTLESNKSDAGLVMMVLMILSEGWRQHRALGSGAPRWRRGN